MAEFRILVAEDDDDDYFILKESFDQYSECELRRAKDGKLLMEYLVNQKLNSKLPDLILLDLNMPRIDGIRSLELLKSIQPFSSIPVIIHSTTNDIRHKTVCMALGAKGFTTKGVTLTEINA